ncbi:MAG: glycosyltransferase [Rhodospirillaceae bacterium]|nr:glycosyltransferase [Rhodospirillaceae bacterium]
MKIAVITPYHVEPLDMLKRAHDSVAAQTHDCTHYMVADGHARAEIDGWNVRHIPLPVEHGNNGNTPRAIGSMDAIGDGFDAIAYLDADNWFEPDHIATLVTLHSETGADLVSSGRVIHAIDGTVLLPDGETGDGERHADTSAIMVAASGFSVVPIWALMPDEMGPNCDRVFFQAAMRIGLKHEHSEGETLHFTSRYGPHYRATGLPVPPDANGMTGIKTSKDFIRRMRALDCKDLMSRDSVDRALNHRAALPITVIVLADEAALEIETRKIIDGLELKLGKDAEFYFTTAEELVSDSDVSASRRNVFVLVFESVVDDWQSLEEFLGARGDLRLIYVRSSTTSENNTINAPINSFASAILVDDKSLHETYQQENRYGAGHVYVASTTQDKTERLSQFITDSID